MSGDGTLWKQLLPDEKVRAVKKMARQDMTARQIADALGTKPHHVRTVADKHNIVLMHHVSPDTLPVVHDETEDMRDTPYNRRLAAWQRAVHGAQATRKLSTGYPQRDNGENSTAALREAHRESTDCVTTGQVSEANALSPANGAALQGGLPSTQAYGALT